VEAAYRSVEVVKNLLRDIDMTTTLTGLNIPPSAIPAMATASVNVTRLMANNPKRMTAKDSEKVYEKAL
jgi:alcohol dehydrogenase class IV